MLDIKNNMGEILGKDKIGKERWGRLWYFLRGG